MFWKQLFATKSLESLQVEVESEHRLRRVLGPISLTALGVGAIIGAGIFVMTGRVAAQDAGPAVVLSFVVAGIGCLFAALCYAEFASMAPVAGSAYTYAYATLGEMFAWIIGWNLVLEYAMACACVASSWSKYFNEFLTSFSPHAKVPAFLCSDPFSTPGALFNLPALLITLAVTVILVRGIRESAVTNAILVGIKLGVVLFVIAVGIAFVERGNWTDIPVSERLPSAPGQDTEKWGLLGMIGLNRWLVPIDDATRSPFVPYGLAGIICGASIVFFAYIGFDAISTQAEEAKRPQRDVPLAILISLALCTVLYIGVAAVLTGMVPYSRIDSEAAVASAFRQTGEQRDSPLLKGAGGLIAVGAIAGMASTLLITFLSQTRIFLAMARDGLIPPSIFAVVHPLYKTPHRSTLLIGVVISLVAAFTPIIMLEKMVNIGTLMAFVMVCAAVLVLRVRRPHAERPFRTPWLFVVGPLGIVVNLIMMLFLSPETWLRLVVWLAVGLAIYFGYGWRHSHIGRQLLFEKSGGGERKETKKI